MPLFIKLKFENKKVTSHNSLIIIILLCAIVWRQEGLWMPNKLKFVLLGEENRWTHSAIGEATLNLIKE